MCRGFPFLAKGRPRNSEPRLDDPPAIWPLLVRHPENASSPVANGRARFELFPWLAVGGASLHKSAMTLHIKLHRSLLRLAASAGLCLSFTGLFVDAGYSQVPPALNVPSNLAPVPVASEISRLLEEGRQLESQRRWVDALSHYETATKTYPSQAELQQRLTVARAHYDVARRYSDGSFSGAVGRLSQQQALGLYDEILNKIQTYHYKEPNWDHLLRRGVFQFDVSLDDPAFLKQNAPKATPEAIARVRQELAKVVEGRKFGERALAKEVAQMVSSWAFDRLEIPPSATLMEFACGAAGGLDEYSSFLTGTQVEEVFSQIEGNFVGLGVELKTDNGTLLIVNVITGGPAARGGLKIGDRVVAVDGKTSPQYSPDQLADGLRGEEGSSVDVTVVGGTGAKRTLRLIRQRVEVPSVEDARIVDKQNGIGYFKLTSFQKTTDKDVDAALWKLHGEGMRSLIIDLRGNPGGLLKAAVDVADKFVNEGMIVATRGRSPREDFDHKGQIPGTWRVPLVILIDNDSASASEILAGAIRDHRRGVVVGTRSYGKGSVQGIFPLANSVAGIRLTTAQWYTPSGQAISGQGIAPDVEVRTQAKPPIDQFGQAGAIPATEDAALKAGLTVARDQAARRENVVSQKVK